MKQAFCKNEVFLESITQALNADGFHLWWLGQSGFLIQWNKRRILLDPYLSDSLTKKYSQTDKPHVRMTELVVDPKLLPEMDIVTSSHNHTDHLDAETLHPIFENSPKAHFIIPEANRQFVCDRIKKPIEFPIGLNDGQFTHQHGYTIHAVIAAHNEIERDSLGRSIYLGYVIQFGKWTLYHSGDTMLYDGMEDILRPFKIDFALLPINGNDPARRVAGNLNGQQAAQLAKSIGAKIVIPHHYDLFEFNTASPEWFESCCKELNQSFYTMQVGEGIQILD